MRPLFILLLAVAGCATPGPKPKWLDDAQLQFDASKYPDDAAVVLYRAEKTALVEDGNNSFTRRERHEVTAVRGEAGFWLAEVKVPTRATDKLLAFHARLVQPDGSRREFDARDFLSDVSAKGERAYNAHFFRFPDVRVGSVLEYWWALESERFQGGDEQDTLGEFPVRRYEFELTAARPLVVETAVFNGASPIEVRENGNGQHQLLFTLQDLPRRERVDFAPHWTFTEPRWAWRVVAYRDRSITYDWYRDWKHVVERRGVAFNEEKLLAGFDHRLDAPAGCDALCLAARARDFVHARTSSSGVRWDRAEPLAAALSSGKASTTERALMMRALLQRAGLEVQLAFGTAALGRQVSPSFPNLEQFDHLFVVLPVQPGVARPTTLDPACSFCAPGTLVTRHRDEPVYVFETKKTVLGANVTEGRWSPAVAEPAPRAERRVTHLARVEADGVVADELAHEALGLEADGPVEDEKGGKKLLGQERDYWRRSSPLADVTEATRGECAWGRCVWTSKARFPGQAWKDGEGWNVHLGFLAPAWLTLFDRPEREADVHFGWDDSVFREVVELTAPPGTKLVTWPEPTRLSVGALRVEVLVERTERGARITRSLERKLGAASKSEYPQLREVADAFKRARQLVLTFR